MAKNLFGGLWDKISGAEAYRQEQEKIEKQRQQAKAAAEREEQARQARLLAQQKKDFLDEVHMHLYRIEKKVQPGYNNPADDYRPVKVLEQKAKDRGWIGDYASVMGPHCVRLREKVISGLAGDQGAVGLCDALSAMSCLKCALVPGEQRDKAEKASEVIFQTIRTVFSTECYLTYKSYGENVFPLDNPDEMARLTKEIDSVMERVSHAEEMLRTSDRKTSFDNIIAYLSPELIKDECMLMWYYAKRWPFDANAFNKSRKLYLSHTAMFYGEKDPDNENQYLCYGTVEEVLARVYAKNKIGGIGTAKQEKPYIDLWLKSKLEVGDHDPCYALAHGLAWMELYEMEIEVLRQLIKAGADVPAELQDRLTFLENGGTADIKVYDIEPFNNIFFFDTSPLEWSGKDMATFFRKVAMKKNRFQYSLALTKWTKTLPLASGQKISYDALHKAFKDLVEDFDGEVSCNIRNAATVNLGNAVFPDATLFTFNSLRNRCVDILFYCEKFGRNLNITIYTLFTPDAQLDFEDMEQNCLAIKENMYVESFRESILQVVDETIKVKQTVYEDDDAPRKKMVFDD